VVKRHLVSAEPVDRPHIGWGCGAFLTDAALWGTAINGESATERRRKMRKLRRQTPIPIYCWQIRWTRFSRCLSRHRLWFFVLGFVRIADWAVKVCNGRSGGLPVYTTAAGKQKTSGRNGFFLGRGPPPLFAGGDLLSSSRNHHHRRTPGGSEIRGQPWFASVSSVGRCLVCDPFQPSTVLNAAGAIFYWLMSGATVSFPADPVCPTLG